MVEKAEDLVDDAVDELEKSGVSEKLDAFTEKVEDKTEDLIEKAIKVGKDLSEKADSFVDNLTEQFKNKNNPEETKGESHKKK